MKAVLQELPECAMGNVGDNFHIQEIGTQAALAQRLVNTQGYLLLSSSEGGNLLADTWPKQGLWKREQYPDLQRLLPTAQGS